MFELKRVDTIAYPITLDLYRSNSLNVQLV